jgi:hypothetical protein
MEQGNNDKLIAAGLGFILGVIGMLVFSPFYQDCAIGYNCEEWKEQEKAVVLGLNDPNCPVSVNKAIVIINSVEGLFEFHLECSDVQVFNLEEEIPLVPHVIWANKQ